MAATNRPEMVDVALRRGGRLSRTREIPLPDMEQRLALLDRFCARMPLRGVDLWAVFATLAGAVTTLVLDQMEQRLAAVTLAPPQRVVDAESVARFDARRRPRRPWARYRPAVIRGQQ